MAQSILSKRRSRRQSTMISTATSGDDAVPETDPSTTSGLLAERLDAWRQAVSYLEEYILAVEKTHKAHAKEYERVLKTISKPLTHGQHFDQSLGGVAGFFENMRVNTQALINTNLETEKNIKGSVLPILERLNKEIKHKVKEVSHGAHKGAKDIEKARNATQKQIEFLGQHAAAFETTGGKVAAKDDPYVLQRQVLYRLHQQILEENNAKNDRQALQTNFQSFEAHVIEVLQQAFEAFNQFVGGQAEKTRSLYADMLAALQRMPPDFEWKAFVRRCSDQLVDPNEEPRSLENTQFPNMDHSSTKPLIEGSLERKSRNKLSFGYQTNYYVVTPSKWLHEFKDNDFIRKEPIPELSIFLPDAVIGLPNEEKFHIKGKDYSKTLSSKLSGTSELAFKAHSAADAQKWFEIIKNVAGATGPAEASSPTQALSPDHKAQDSGVTGEGTAAISAPKSSTPDTSKGTDPMGNSKAVATGVTPPTAGREKDVKE